MLMPVATIVIVTGALGMLFCCVLVRRSKLATIQTAIDFQVFAELLLVCVLIQLL